MSNKKAIIICVALVTLAIVLLSTILILVMNNSKPSESENKIEPAQFQQTINDIDWTVKYNFITKAIISITATISENDRSSIYWEEIRRRYGDSSLSVKHEIILNGKPIGGGWFRIEKQEIYQYENEIFYNSTTRIEEKFNFTIPLS